MIHSSRIALARIAVLVVSLWLLAPQPCTGMDIRGPWVGTATGAVFGAKGSVHITRQHGEDIYGIVEGQNMFGRARFDIAGKIRGNHIFGEKEGHIFEGFVYPDGAIRGLFRAANGEKYSIFLHRPYPYWGVPYGTW